MPKALADAPRLPAVSLCNLITAGLLVPGADVLSVSYKGSTHHASLTPGGAIEWNGRAYSSASAFSIAVKRLATPDKQGDDGWKSVFYRERPLDELRQEFRGKLNLGSVPRQPPRTRRAKRAAPEPEEDERESEWDETAVGPSSAAIFPGTSVPGRGGETVVSANSHVSMSTTDGAHPRWAETSAGSRAANFGAEQMGVSGSVGVSGAPISNANPSQEMASGVFSQFAGGALLAPQIALLQSRSLPSNGLQTPGTIAFAASPGTGSTLSLASMGSWPVQDLPPGFCPRR